MTYDAYSNNPLIHRDRRLGKSESRWVREFACEDMSVLIVCRGPIRKEAIDVFREMGITRTSASCSARRTASCTRARSPPSCACMNPENVHRVPTTRAPPRKSVASASRR
jgi:hypothetical protein